MRQAYIPDSSTEQAFKRALNTDLGVYQLNNQTGFGIGGFFKKLFKHAIPIGKSLLKSGIELAKPELKKLAVKGIDKATDYGVRKLENIGSNKNGAKKQKYGVLS